jgi:hypothetical protein
LCLVIRQLLGLLLGDKKVVRDELLDEEVGLGGAEGLAGDVGAGGLLRVVDRVENGTPVAGCEMGASARGRAGWCRSSTERLVESRASH